MTLSELIAEVYTITNRPDLVAETLTAVRAATLKLHQLDYWYKDLREIGIAFATSAYQQQLEYRLLFPQWRALKYLRKSDLAGTDTGPFFTVLTIPELTLNEYGINRSNVCYVAGEVIQIRSSTEFQYAFLGRYDNPNITSVGYSSWIALDHPYGIIYEAAAGVFKMIGESDKYATFQQLSKEEQQLIRISNIQPVGY